MPNTRFKNSKGKKKQNSNRRMLKQGGATYYAGPLILPGSNEEMRIQRSNCSYIAAQTCSGGGAFQAVWSDATLLFLTIDWVSVQATWHEYRILAWQVEWIPVVEYSSTYRYGPLVSVIDHTAGGTLASYNAGASHESAKMHMSNLRWKREVRATGPEEMEWKPINTTTNNTYIKIYGDGFLPVSTIMAQAVFTFLVELRGRS